MLKTNLMQSGINPKPLSAKVPLMVLPVRTMLFAIIQIMFVYVLGFSWKESIAWWPFFAICTNVIVFFLLHFLAKNEGKTYLDLISFDKKQLKQDLVRVLWILPVGGGLGMAGMSAVSYFMYGTPMAPDAMIVPLPLWAAAISILLFPISNALVEIPTYMGYCFPRLEMVWQSKITALAFSAFFLSFQHFTLPILIDDPKYMVWHAICFIPLALVVGLIYIKTRRLVPILIVHWLMDVMVVLPVLLLSI